MSEIFRPKKIEEAAVISKDKEKGRKLTPIERYVRNTPAGNVLRELEKDPYIATIKKNHTRTGSLGIDSLKKHGIIEIKEGKVVEFHYENLINLWGDTKGPRILELFNEEQKELTVRQISKLLKASFNHTNDEISKIKNSGLLETTKIGGTRVFYLPEHSEKIKIQQEKLPGGLIDGNKGTKQTFLEKDEQTNKKIESQILSLLDNSSLVELRVVCNELDSQNYDSSSVLDRIYALRDIGLLEIVLKHRKGKKPIFLRKLVPKEKE